MVGNRRVVATPKPLAPTERDINSGEHIYVHKLSPTKLSFWLSQARVTIVIIIINFFKQIAIEILFTINVRAFGTETIKINDKYSCLQVIRGTACSIMTMKNFSVKINKYKYCNENTTRCS